MTPKIYIIAEAGVNHNGDRDKAFALVEAAAAAGADAVKFQTFDAKRLAAVTAPKAAYQEQTTGAEGTQLEMLKAVELPLDWHKPLQTHARDLEVEFISTAFETHSLAFLETLNLPFYKVPSGELTNGPLLWAFAHTGKPLVVSTGMATMGEVEQALAIICHGLSNQQPPTALKQTWECWSDDKARAQLNGHVSLLHCTSQYPTPMTQVNLAAMDTLKQAFGLPVGYSDHTQGITIPITAAARGASIIEKHFTLDRNLPGPDHAASLEPDELADMVTGIRDVEHALGRSTKTPQPSEWNTRKAARQNLVAAASIAKGDVFTADNLTTARAGNGLSAMQYWDQLGKVAERGIQAGEAL